MSRLLLLAVAAVLAAQSALAAGQLRGLKDREGCIAVSDANSTVTAKGRLTLRHMAGPPNFESIREGDEDRPTLILVLPTSVCIDDGGEFADPKVRFNTVHIWPSDAAIHRKLDRAVGKIVAITGKAYARTNALHYAPLVIGANTVITQRR